MSSTEEYQQKQFYATESKVATTAEAKNRYRLIAANFGHIPSCVTVRELEKEIMEKNFKRKQQ